MTECAMCGDCCRAIAVKLSLKELRAIARNGRDWDRYVAAGGEDVPASRNPSNEETARFVSGHWHRISKAEAERRLPGFSQQQGKKFYYECDALDPATNRCTAHDDRPPICKGFPFYDGTVAGLHFAYRRCSFWADVPEERQPQGEKWAGWLDPLPSPDLIQLRRKEDIP